MFDSDESVDSISHSQSFDVKSSESMEFLSFPLRTPPSPCGSMRQLGVNKRSSPETSFPKSTTQFDVTDVHLTEPYTQSFNQYATLRQSKLQFPVKARGMTGFDKLINKKHIVNTSDSFNKQQSSRSGSFGKTTQHEEYSSCIYYSASTSPQSYPPIGSTSGFPPTDFSSNRSSMRSQKREITSHSRSLSSQIIINDLNSLNLQINSAPSWTITGRIVLISPYCTNKTGSTFYVLLLCNDLNQLLRVFVWSDQFSIFSDITTNGACSISNGAFKVNSDANRIPFEGLFHLYANNATQFSIIDDENTIPPMHIPLITLSQVSTFAANSLITVAGIVLHSAFKEYETCDTLKVSFIDPSSDSPTQITLSDNLSSYSFDQNSFVLFENLSVHISKNMVSLQSNSFTRISVEPSDDERFVAIMNWRDYQLAHTNIFSELSELASVSQEITYVDVSLSILSSVTTVQNSQYFVNERLLCKFSAFFDYSYDPPYNTTVYEGCPNNKCRASVNVTRKGLICSKCSRSVALPQWRLIHNPYVRDDTGITRVRVAINGSTLGSAFLSSLNEDAFTRNFQTDRSDFDAQLRTLDGCKFKFTASVSINSWNQEPFVTVSVNSVSELI